ncbi:major facilitator superfamily transporter [Hyaloscypha variabilis]|uniref:Major facilitator superfamily transporter n=1 Tax=Hyaloscypha variabilis (strain UAMH 11265 / GT02V1 / F) TaxID=1149755 RepID=A0A2J6R1T7_HYAVF|nr:major facilitator superfamily transporter [Hyaloscypha variabilis F]
MNKDKTLEIAEAREDAPEIVEDEVLKKGHMNYDLVDEEVAKYASETIVEVDEETSSRLKRMIDKRILAIMIGTYLIQTLDKGTMSFASIMGIIDETHLVGTQYSWLTSIIYIIILVVEYPENWIIQRVPIAKWLGLNIILWGITLSLHAAMKNFAGLVTLRAFLGLFEAVSQPTFVLLSGMWYKRDEQAGAVIYWYMMNGVQQVFGSLLAFGFSFVPKTAAINSWQALFMTYGIITVFWGAFVLYWTPDSPMKAKCFTEEDKKLMIERVRENRTGVQNRKFRKDQVWDAACDPQVYAFALIQLFLTLPSGGLGAYANIIIKSFGFTTWQTQLLQMVSGVIQVISMLSAVWVDKRTKQTILPMMASVIPTIAGTVVLMTVPFEHSKRVGLLFAYYIMISFWACSGLALSLVTRNVAGQTKKSIVISVNFVFWATGNSIGPQVFQTKDAPRYFLALSIILGCFILLMITLGALRTYYIWQNKRRDGKIERGEAVADALYTHALEDITDRKNVNFRYIY